MPDSPLLQKKKQKGQGRDKGAHADPRRAEFDVDAEEASHQQQARERRRRQGFDQIQRPIGLDRSGVFLEAVELLQAVEAVDLFPDDAQAFSLLAGEHERLARFLQRLAPLPGVGVGQFVHLLGREEPLFTGGSVAVDGHLELWVNHRG